MRKRPHYAWAVLACCCIMQGIGIGIISNCAGLYYSPICAELGFSMGKLTLYKTISGVFSIFSMMLAPRLIKRFDIRPLSFFLIVCAGGANLLMSFSNKLWHWYAIGVLQGCTLTCFSHFLPVAALNNWFHEKGGLAMGLSCSSSGALGIIMSRVLSALIIRYGWRTSALVNGIVCIALAAPFVLFVLRYRPEDMGLLPYGERAEAAAKPTPASESEQKPRSIFSVQLFLVMVFAVCAKSTSSFGQYLDAYGTSLGMAPALASLMLTLYLVGNTAFKLTFGIVNDKLGVRKSTTLELGVLLTGFLLMLTHKPGIMFAGAILFGMSAMVSNVQSPLLIRSLWSKEAFSLAYSRITVAADACYYLAITLFGFLYDSTHRYEPAMLVCCGFIAIEFTIMNIVLRRRHLQSAGNA